MKYQNMQEVADKFEAAYIQSGGLLLSVKYYPEQDAFIANPEFEGLDEEETEEVVGDVNASYEGFKLALQYQAVQSIAPADNKASWYFTPFTWAKNNRDPEVEHLECSSKGEKRYSAFCAYMDDGRTLEQHYQCDVKGYDVGGKDWRLGKGKEPLILMTPEEQYQKYKELWAKFLTIDDYSHLMNQPARLLTDMFATSDINQARAIADLMNEYIAYRVQQFKAQEEPEKKQPTVVHLGQGHVGISQGAYEDRYALMFVTLTDPVPLGADLESNIELEADQIQVAIKVDNLESLKVLKHQLSCLEDNMKLENQVLIIDKKTGEVTKTIEPVIVPYQNHCGDKERQCTPCYTNQGECADQPKDGGALPNNQGEYPEDTQYTREQQGEPKYYKYDNDKWHYHHTQDDLWRLSALNYLNKDTIHQLHDLIPVRPEIPLAHTIDPRYKTYTENPDFAGKEKHNNQGEHHE